MSKESKLPPEHYRNSVNKFFRALELMDYMQRGAFMREFSDKYCRCGQLSKGNADPHTGRVHMCQCDSYWDE